MSVQDRTLLETATQVLLASPTASLADVAAAAGVSRTTLHSRYPTRQALLIALAHEAMDLVDAAYAGARLGQGSVEQALQRFVEMAVPLGPRLQYLMRERSLETDSGVVDRCVAIDQPLLDLVERGQRNGYLRADQPSWWITQSILALVYMAWESITEGRLARLDAPALILSSVLRGAAGKGAEQA